eukprot:TRINITY_DN23493_c0_g1_i1.p1 TRINITY_DN23493_c0_g1~~TRINITY_DN23493_c0_g1_i1.p1  ORF type:complete len:891 (+),score=82.89 TRINITY_DN23493_c0_g1_i1:155-2674(+)
MDSLKSRISSIEDSGLDDGISSVDGHDVIEAWIPEVGACRSKCALCTTLRLRNYPWPGAAQIIAHWVRHHLELGFECIFIFIEGVDVAIVSAILAALAPWTDSQDCVQVIEDEEMRAAWPAARDFIGGDVDGRDCKDFSIVQSLNCATALRLCRDSRNVEWLFSNMDIDELIHIPGGDAACFFGAARTSMWQIVLLNNEAIGAGCEDWELFQTEGLVKVSPLTKLPFVSRCFPSSDEEPQVLEHPDGSGARTQEYWRSHRTRLAEQFGFKDRHSDTKGTYFDGYARGKCVIRVSVAYERRAQPRVHRWLVSDTRGLQTVVCSPSHASIVRYNSCGGVEWFAARYSIRSPDATSGTKYHILYRSASLHGEIRSATCSDLDHVYNSMFSIDRETLKPQVEEGFMFSLHKAESSTGQQASHVAGDAFAGFWGWAVVSLENDLCVHIPLTSGSHLPHGFRSLQEACAEPPTAVQEQRLCVGECYSGKVANSEEISVVLRIRVAELDRGELVLDVLPTALGSEASGNLFLCASKSGRAPNIASGDFQWSSGPMVSGFDGWRCRIQAHRWVYGCPDIMILLGVGEAPESLSDQVAYQGVRFEPLVAGSPVDSLSNEACLRFDAKLLFVSEAEGLPPVVQAAHQAFYMAYQGQHGRRISDYEREMTNRGNDRELTYGEVEFLPFLGVMTKVVQPQSGEVFLDLGSGTGRALLVASLGFPFLKRCIGYEVLELLHKTAEAAVDQVARSMPPDSTAPVDLRLKSFIGEPWEEEGVDILWVASLCFRRETTAEIKERARRLRPGARIITMDPFFGEADQGFEQVLVDGSAKIIVEMSFGEASVYVTRRV